MGDAINASVLVIDDEELVRDNIEEILVPHKTTAAHQLVNEAADILFSGTKPILENRNTDLPRFTVDKASNGMEGVAKVKAALDAGKPYAVIFLDMRMPGWDGLQTAIEIRKVDTKAEIIFVTAYSDKTIEDIVAQAGQNVGYHCKPYASEEIIQLATKAVNDYSRLRNMEKLIAAISSFSLHAHDLTPLLKNILEQLSAYVGSETALLGRLYEDLTYEKLFAIGPVESRINVEELIKTIQAADVKQEEVRQVKEVIMTRLDHYTIFIITQQQLKTEKIYLLKLFMQNAARAIQNAELYERVMQQEKLSAVGKAIGMVMHDLRGPVGAVKMIVEMMEMEGIQNEWMAPLKKSGNEAMAIFEDYLDFLKDIKAKKQLLALLPLVKEIVQQIQDRRAVAQLQIEVQVEEQLMVNCDESKMKRILANLINNAIDVSVDYKVSNPRVTLRAAKAALNDNVQIEVRDNGPGIAPGIMRTLFEPFVTKHKSYGTGLGLAIVKQFVEAHSGTITVHNDGGAVFLIEL